MKVIIDCHWESDDKLEVETWENTEIIIRSVVNGAKVGIALDKKKSCRSYSNTSRVFNGNRLIKIRLLKG